MTGPQGMGPLVPGGGLPGAPGGTTMSEYDLAVEALSPIWYCWDMQQDDIVWPAVETVTAGDFRNETVKGLYWFDAWFREADEEPVDYEAAMTHTDVIWFSTLNAAEAIVWPAVETVTAGDFRNESVKGLYWFDAWFQESGEEPVDYAAAATHTDAIWFSQIGEMDTSTSTLPTGGTITTSGGYRYHTFTNSLDGFWTMSPDPFDVEILLVGGGGGGRNTNNVVGNDAAGGGGGGGEVKVVSLSVSDGSLIIIGSGGSGGISATSGGNTTGLGQTAIGGGPGGHPNIDSGAGGAGGSGGGGGCEVSVAVSGAGGTGSAGNNGGAGASAATVAGLRAGGGGGAGAVGTSGVSGSTYGYGGDGLLVWGSYYGGGGAGGHHTGFVLTGSLGGGGGVDNNGGGLAGTANTGGGQGGSDGHGQFGTAGSGIVKVRYPE